MKVIYCIDNQINGKCYIGSAIDFKRRKREHLNKLRKGIHHSYFLQKSWNKYGENSFKIFILEILIDAKDLIQREQWWIDNITCDYNMCKTAGSVLGLKHSQETKDKLSNNQFKGKLGIDNSFSKKCYQYDLNGKFVKEWDAIKDIERELKFSNSLIVRCLKGKTRTAYKYQWFYEFKGDKIDKIKVKECQNNIRNRNLFNEMQNYLETNTYTSCKQMAIDLNKPYSTIRSAFYRYKNKLKLSKK